MKNRILKISIIPMFYILIGIVFFGNQEAMMIAFSSFIAFIYYYLIDSSKSLKANFIETSGGILVLFLITAFFKETDKILVVKYISLTLFLFSMVFLLKKKYVS